MATEMLMEISQDEAERARFMSRKKFEMDLLSDIHTAAEVGREEGKAEGEAKGKIEGKIEERREIVNHMYQEGFDVKTIAKATRLSEQDVKDIINSKDG